jgi:hypothetical protein
MIIHALEPIQISNNNTYWVPAQTNYRDSKFRKSEFQFSDSPNIGIKKKIQLESLESQTESESRLQWGSQKSEPKIGIPNQEVRM